MSKILLSVFLFGYIQKSALIALNISLLHSDLSAKKLNLCVNLRVCLFAPYSLQAYDHKYNLDVNNFDDSIKKYLKHLGCNIKRLHFPQLLKTETSLKSSIKPTFGVPKEDFSTISTRYNRVYI